MSARSTVRRGLETTIGRERTTRIRRFVYAQERRAPADPKALETAYHLSIIREELIRSRSTNAGILAALKDLRRTDDGDAAERTLSALQAIGREVHSARTIPSVPIALRQRSVEQSVDYILSEPRYADVAVSIQKAECLEAALNATTIDGLVCEFGAGQGESLTQITRHFPDRTVHAFDGAAAPLDDVVAGLKAEHAGPFAFVHLDLEQYSPTTVVTEQLSDWFVAGTVVVFDEYFGYHGWQHHEHQAFMELLERSGLSFEAISLGHMNVGLRLVEAGATGSATKVSKQPGRQRGSE